MSSVTVLCPNGRREAVKVQPQTKILQILEEVCKKQGLNPSDYEIIGQKRHFDVQLTFRLSGITNNAQLELKKLDAPRKLDDVVIVLQLDDSTRLPQQSFKPDETLMNILNRFKDAENSLLVIPETHIDPEETIEPVCSYLHEEIIGIFQLENTSLMDLGLTGGRAIIRFNYRKFENTELDKLVEEFRVKIQKKQQIEEKYRSKQEEQQQVEPVEEAAAAATVEVQAPSQQPEILDHQLPHVHLTRTQTSEIDENTSRAFSDSPQLLNSEFSSFKFPESTKGMELNQVNALADIEKLSKEPCPREALIYNSDEGNKMETQTNEDVSEDFYDVTIQDLRMMISDLQRQTSEDQPLMTKTMRELEQDKKAMKYEQIVIRVRFRNKYILQGLFRPKEPVSRLYEFVRESIQTTSGEDFYLYTTPPKQVLNDKKKTLFDCKLYPAAIIHFGSESGQMPEFKTELEVKSFDEANQVVMQNVHQRMRQVHDEGIEWLEKERKLMQNLVKSTGISSGEGSGVNVQQQQRSGNVDDLTRQKFSKFLGKK